MTPNARLTNLCVEDHLNVDPTKTCVYTHLFRGTHTITKTTRAYAWIWSQAQPNVHTPFRMFLWCHLCALNNQIIAGIFVSSCIPLQIYGGHSVWCGVVRYVVGCFCERHQAGECLGCWCSSDESVDVCSDCAARLLDLMQLWLAVLVVQISIAGQAP